jgi:hypothetical protein
LSQHFDGRYWAAPGAANRPGGFRASGPIIKGQASGEPISDEIGLSSLLKWPDTLYRPGVVRTGSGRAHRPRVPVQPVGA